MPKNKKEASSQKKTSETSLTNIETGIKKPFTNEQIALIKRTVAKGATDDELKLFLIVANKAGLDPFSKQIHFVKRKNTKTGEYIGAIQTGIDGQRAIAERTGEYAGSDDVIYDSEAKTPTWAKSSVYRIVKGVRVPFTATARWNEFKPAAPNDFMWNKMPYHMLGKVAEAQALRKAFPNDLSGIYVEEEMEHMGRVVTDANEVTVKTGKVEADVKTPAEASLLPPKVKLSSLDKLFEVAREFGAEQGKEDIFIQTNLDTDIDWENLVDRDIANLKTRLLAKLTPKNNA